MPYDQGGNWAPGVMYDQGGNPYCDQPPDDWGRKYRRTAPRMLVYGIRYMTSDELRQAALRCEEASPSGRAESS